MTTRATCDRIRRLNSRFAIAAIGSFKRDKIVVEFNDDGDVVGVWEFTAFKRNLYAEQPAEVVIGDDKNKKTKHVEFAEYWLRHREARSYRSLVFAPPGSTTAVGPNDYNTWRGLAVVPSPGEWDYNRFHIRQVICAGNEEHEHWMHNWIAALVQRPGEHGWVAPLLKGGQGIGKGYFANSQLGGVFRARNYAHLTVPEHLTSDFNSHLEDRVYVFADEAVWGEKRVANRLKGLITEKEIMINRKHVPQEIQQSALHIVIASNAERPLPVERDDRRLFVLQVSEEFKQNQDYFQALIDELRDGGREAMLNYFLNFEVDWELLRVPPETTAKREMKAESLSPENEWWREVLETADERSWVQWQTKIARSLVVARYSEWFDDFKGRGNKKSASSLGAYFARHFKAGGMPSWPKNGGKIQQSDVGKRDNSWVFPTLAECRAVFDRATGTDHDWPADEPESVHPAA